MHELSTRRSFLLAGASTMAGLSLSDVVAQPLPLDATPECRDGPTVRQTEGPFYKPRSPERMDLREPGAKARAIELTGFVLQRNCKSITRALIDLWHADERGDYDDRGFRYRGHVFTDAVGRFRFITILPALYTGRTRHFHVKVQAPGKPLLTTQLYFPNEPGNSRDPIFRRDLVMKTTENADAIKGRFDFVVA